LQKPSETFLALQKQQTRIVSALQKRNPDHRWFLARLAQASLSWDSSHVSLVNRSSGDTPNTGSADNNLSAENTGASPAPLMVEARQPTHQRPHLHKSGRKLPVRLSPLSFRILPTPGFKNTLRKNLTESYLPGKLYFTIDAGRSELLVTPYDDQSTM
jgi:hypothetical protein